MRKGNGDEESVLFSSPSGVLAENENDSGALLPEKQALVNRISTHVAKCCAIALLK